MIIPYSAIKRTANPPAEYSTLNPDTNSDSASTISNGARFVSAKQMVSQDRTIGNQTRPHHRDQPFSDEEKNLIPPLRKITTTRVILRQISYEITWAKPRTLPTRAYLELDAHPLIIATCAFNLVTTKKNKMSLEHLEDKPLEGKICQPIKHRRREIEGTIKKIRAEFAGMVNSFINSFIPSVTGCKIPPTLILLGPKRIPKALRHLRSIKVKYATLNKTPK